MKNLRVLLALAAVSVAASACGSDPVAVSDPGQQLKPRYETATPPTSTNTDPGDPADPSLPGSGGAIQILGSGT
jgi:hypothetical protein